MKTPLFIAVLCASACLAGRVETITLELERPSQPFSIVWTEATDATVTANLRSSGAEFDVNNWTGVLWYGTTNAGGTTLTNSTAGYGSMSWNVPVTSMPTNGRYTVIVFGSITNRLEEWGRGALNVRLNPARSFLPAEWRTGDVAYIAATNALAFCYSPNNPPPASSSVTNYVVAIATNGVTKLFIVTE